MREPFIAWRIDKGSEASADYGRSWVAVGQVRSIRDLLHLGRDWKKTLRIISLWFIYCRVVWRQGAWPGRNRCLSSGSFVLRVLGCPRENDWLSWASPSIFGGINVRLALKSLKNRRSGRATAGSSGIILIRKRAFVYPMDARLARYCWREIWMNRSFFPAVYVARKPKENTNGENYKKKVINNALNSC